MNQNERLNSFKKTVIGKYVLKQLINKEEKECMYLDNIGKWEYIKENKIYFNLLDLNGANPFKKFIKVVIENFLKKNFLIIRIESETSSLSFYCNNLPNMNLESGLVEIQVDPFDFIASKDSPTYNDTYTVSYILNDPSKEFDVVNTDTTKEPSAISQNFPTKAKVIIPKGIPQKKVVYSKSPDVPSGVANFPVVFVNERVVANNNKKKSISEEKSTFNLDKSKSKSKPKPFKLDAQSKAIILTAGAFILLTISNHFLNFKKLNF